MPASRNTLRDLFYRNGHLLALTVIVVVLAGASALMNLPRIEDPYIVTRNALIITTFPGASAERVEALVTKKLEDELREVAEIKIIQSTSRANISVITIELQDSIDGSTNEQAFSRVRDKLADAETLLPPGASKPDFDDERATAAFAIVVGLSAPGSDAGQLGLLSRLAEELGDQLRNIPGARRVNVYGDSDEEITVTLDRGELAGQGLTAARVARLVAAADPKNAAGALRASDRDLFLEVAGELDSVSRIRNLVLRQGAQGRQLRLGDVATVERRWLDPPASIGYVDGRRTVFVAAAAQPDLRLDDWQAAADEVIDEFRQTLGDGVDVEVVFRQLDYTATRLASLTSNLLLGAGVVVLVVLVGMGWRAALIVGAALPLTMFATLFGLTFAEQQIHQMSIFGMIIAIGLLIDNAIVVTDEIQMRLRDGMERQDAVNAAIGHLSAPLIASTITTILGFMPIFLLPGNIGDFVGPIAIAVVLALAASWVLSMTVIAALAGRFIPSRRILQADKQWWCAGVQFPQLQAWSQRQLVRFFSRPLVTAAAALVLPVSGFVLASTIGLQFFPTAERDQFEIEVWMPQEASLSLTESTAEAIETVVRAADGVEQISWLIGASHPQVYYNRIMKQDQNGAYAHALVKADTPARASRLVRQLGPALDAQFPQAQIIVAPFAQGPPVDAPIGFRIVGPSLPMLKSLGDEVRRIMHTVPEVTHTRATVATRTKLALIADQTEVESAGLSLSGVAQQLQGNLEGFTGGSVREDLEELPVRIRYANDVRGSLANITSMPLLAEGRSDWVPANAIGNMRLEPESASITRRNGERLNIIYGWTVPDALPIEVSNRVLAKLEEAGLQLPPGYRLEQEGESDAQRDAVGKLTTYLPVLLMLMLATLVMSFRSVTAAAIVTLVAALSAGLGMLSLWLSGYKLGFNPLIGSAGLIGVAINGAIVVLAGLRASEQAKTGDIDAIAAVTMRETRHVLATTATTMGGFLPLLIFTGGEFWPPLVVVIAGGVGLSVTLSLLLTPALFTLVVQRRQRRRAQLAGRAVATAAMLTLITGCAVGPNYRAPDAEQNADWLEVIPGTTAEAGLEGWWQRFDDPLVGTYVKAALEANHDLQIAEATLREARALGRQVNAGLLPQIGANAAYTRFLLSEDSQAFRASGGRVPREDDLYDAGFDAAWEIDLFGGNRRRAEAASARVASADAAVHATALSVTAEVVRSFAELRGAQRRLTVARRNVSLQEETLGLVEGRVSSGLSPELDALNARAQLFATRSTLPQLEASIRVSIYRLATLTARRPDAVLAELAVDRPIPTAGSALNPGLRSDILRRRPDVRVAERQLAAANADIGVAVANLFPKLTLGGNFGWQALVLDGLGNDATEVGAVQPALSLPLFAGGALRAQVEASRARHAAVLSAYEQTVLLALEESEGALVRYRRSVTSRDELAAAASASAEAADIATRLYDSGLADFLAVLDADRRRLEAEDALARRQTETLVNLVAVYKSLGAG